MKTYEETIRVPQSELAVISRYLNDASDPQGEDGCISKTAVFPNGVEVDIKCCGCDDDVSWTEGVLFDHGSEVCCTEPGDEFLGDWEFECGDARYVVHVVEEGEAQ